jgi:hypothetical protein
MFFERPVCKEFEEMVFLLDFIKLFHIVQFIKIHNEFYLIRSDCTDFLFKIKNQEDQ